MRRLMERTSDRLKGFIAQRDDLALVVRCTTADSAYVLKMLQALDDSGETTMHFSYAEDFRSAPDYADAIVAAFNARHEEVRKLQEKEGETPWPALPPAVLDAKAPPAERLRALMIFSRSLLPAPDGFDVVWTFFPLQVSRHQEYALLFETLLRHEHPVPWCHHMRVILRDEPSVPVLKALPGKVGRVQEFPVDLGPAALQKAMEEDAAAEDLPLPERLQNTMMLAGMDFSNRRYGDALAKYTILLKYYVAAKDHTMTALTLNGMGEVYDRMDKPREARAHFESALNPALQTEARVVLLNVTLNLANLHLKHNSLAEAEIYYDSAAKLSKAQAMPQVMIPALENLGVCRYRQGRVKEGVAAWEEAEGLAKAVEEKELRRKVLVRLQEHYRKAGIGERDKAVTRELQGIG